MTTTSKGGSPDIPAFTMASTSLARLPDPSQTTKSRHTWEPQNDHAQTPNPQPNGHANGHISSNGHVSPSPTTKPDPNTSPSTISLYSFLLGFTLSASILLTLYLSTTAHSPHWRIPYFLTALSLFHFLEYYTTARYNPAAAGVNAFLLTQNGKAYNIAHTMAFLECFVHYHLYPECHYLPEPLQRWWIVLGFALTVLGQATRTTAMAQAGSNFNHLVQSKKKEGHELVTHGVYAWLRHPSYFGFYWWGLGTQVVLGNGVCLVGYTIALWRFFRDRIEKEERFLVRFFGEEYLRYRERTVVGIPFL